MRSLITRWKAWTTKCSSENTVLPSPKNLPWRPRSLEHANCWSTERSRAGYHARLGDDNWLRSVVGERGSGAESGEERIAERSRSARPLADRRRKPAALAAALQLPLVT